MRREIAILAGQREWGMTRESWLARATAKVPNVTFRTVRSLWYGEIKDENHWAAREIRRAVQVIEARREAEKLAQQFESLAVGLDISDPDFHEPTVAALLGAMRKLRGQDRT